MKRGLKESRERAVSLLLEHLFERLSSPAPDTTHSEWPVPIEIEDDWSLYRAMHADEDVGLSLAGDGYRYVEPASGRKPITIRVPNRVLQVFRRESERTGTAYQTLMNRVLADAADALE